MRSPQPPPPSHAACACLRPQRTPPHLLVKSATHTRCPLAQSSAHQDLLKAGNTCTVLAWQGMAREGMARQGTARRSREAHHQLIYLLGSIRSLPYVHLRHSIVGQVLFFLEGGGVRRTKTREHLRIALLSVHRGCSPTRATLRRQRCDITCRHQCCLRAPRPIGKSKPSPEVHGERQPGQIVGVPWVETGHPYRFCGPQPRRRAGAPPPDALSGAQRKQNDKQQERRREPRKTGGRAGCVPEDKKAVKATRGKARQDHHACVRWMRVFSGKCRHRVVS